MMKKLFLLVIGFVMFKMGYAQYPIQQFIGADSAIVTSRGAMQSRFVNVVFADTTAANSQRIRQYPGAMIYASGKLWVRNTTATAWVELAYGPVSSTNIYNSDGTLTGPRTLDGNNDDLTFDNMGFFTVNANPLGQIRFYQGSNSNILMRGDTTAISRRLSYNTNLASSFTKHTLVDKNYVDSSITASPSGTVTSVGLSMPTAFAVANSPVTSSGTLTVTGAGVASQYIRGDGQLATLPTTGGGGSSVSYYLNGSVNQGTFGGTPYYEMSKTAIFGAGTDFTISSNGYIASFITDAGDPALLNIPAGNWDFEVYFQSSSTSGTPSFYVELYKYDGTTFTLIASSSANPKFITGGTAVDAYYTPLAVPSTSLLVTDRLAVRIYVNNSGNTITLHTEDNNLCQIITTFSTGINALNGLTSQVQYLATGTSGTDFNISSLTDTHTFNLPVASATNTGKLSSADWTTFNNKGSVSSVATNTGTGITGGTITTTGTLAIDTNLISTRAWRQKGIDSVTSLINSRPSGSGTTNYLPKWTGSTALGNSLVFDDGTNVGIGTTSPSSKLHVVNGNVDGIRVESSNSGYLEVGKTSGARYRWANDFSTGNTLELLYGASGAAPSTNRITVFPNGNVHFGTHIDQGYRFFVAGNISNTTGAVFAISSGNVLIGTTTDAGYKLDVNGTARVSGTELRLDNGTTGVINLYSTTPEIRFFSSNPTAYRLYRSGTAMILNTGGGIFLQIGGNDAYYVTSSLGHNWVNPNSGGAVLARLTTGGNFLIGTTTDAGYRLDVNGTARVSGTELRLDNGTTGTINLYSATPSIQFFSGDPTGYRLYRSSTSMALSSGGTIVLQISGNNGYTLDATNGHQWRTALSGGAALARLTTGGNFMVGTTTDVASAILQLSSTTKGFLPPKGTNAQMLAIASPVSGLVFYDTTNNKLNVYDGTNWVAVH